MSMWDVAQDKLRLEPIFGPKAWSASSTCDDVHPRGPIPSGSRCCCMVCHQTGVESHPDLKETLEDKLALLSWKPPEGGDQWSEFDLAEPTTYEPDATEPVAETRKERRRRQFAESNQPTT